MFITTDVMSWLEERLVNCEALFTKKTPSRCFLFYAISLFLKTVYVIIKSIDTVMIIFIRLNTKLISGSIGVLKMLNSEEPDAPNIPPPKYLNKSKLFKGKYFMKLFDATYRFRIPAPKKQNIETVTAPT